MSRRKENLHQRQAHLRLTALVFVVGLVTACLTVVGIGAIAGSAGGVGGGSGVGLMAIDEPGPVNAIHIAQSSAERTSVRVAQPVVLPVTTPTTISATSPASTSPVSAQTHFTHKTTSGAAIFNGRRLVKVKTMDMLVTAYSPDARSCGASADGITASGYSVWTNGMKLVAADTRLLPFGTIVSIPGYDHGQPVPVLDRGGKIKGHHLDVLYPTNGRALEWGVKHLQVTIWKYAD